MFILRKQLPKAEWDFLDPGRWSLGFYLGHLLIRQPVHPANQRHPSSHSSSHLPFSPPIVSSHPPIHPFPIHSSFLFLIYSFLHSSTSPCEAPPSLLPCSLLEMTIPNHSQGRGRSYLPLFPQSRATSPGSEGRGATKAGLGVLGVGRQLEDWGEGKRLVAMDQICWSLSPSPHFPVKPTIPQLHLVYRMNSGQPCPVSRPQFPHVADSACSDLLGV